MRLVTCSLIAVTAANDRQPVAVDPPVGGSTFDATTPVVEIEEPLLSATDIVDGLLEQTRLRVDMEGVNILLFTSRDADGEGVNISTRYRFWMLCI